MRTETSFPHRHLLGIEPLEPRRHPDDPRHRAGPARGPRPADQEGARAARQDGREPLLRGLDPDPRPPSRWPRSGSRPTASRSPTAASSVAEGRDAARHGAEPRGDEARHDRHAARRARGRRTSWPGTAGRRSSTPGDGAHEHPTQALLDALTHAAEARGGSRGCRSRSSATSPTAAWPARTCRLLTKMGAQVVVCAARRR